MGTDVRCSSFVNDLCSFETRHRRLELSDHMAVSSHSRPLQAPDCTNTIRGYPHPTDHQVHCQGEALAARQNLRRLRISNAVQNKCRRSQESAVPSLATAANATRSEFLERAASTFTFINPGGGGIHLGAAARTVHARRTVQPLQLWCRHLQVCNKPLDEAVS